MRRRCERAARTKRETYIADAFRGAMGGTFLYLHIAYYMLGHNNDDLPKIGDGVSADVVAKGKGAMGKIGLQAGEVAYLGKNKELNLAQLKAWLRDTCEKEIEVLLALHAEN